MRRGGGRGRRFVWGSEFGMDEGGFRRLEEINGRNRLGGSSLSPTIFAKEPYSVYRTDVASHWESRHGTTTTIAFPDKHCLVDSRIPNTTGQFNSADLFL